VGRKINLRHTYLHVIQILKGLHEKSYVYTNHVTLSPSFISLFLISLSRKENARENFGCVYLGDEKMIK
jgi:hypothetical protein